MRHDVPREALARWPLDVARIEPIKVRENAVYAVHTVQGARVVLRIHRLGYHSDAALQSEFAWLDALGAAGIDVPRVVLSRTGRCFETIEVPGGSASRQADVFEWIDGPPLGSVEGGIGSNAADIERIYAAIGTLAARIHDQATEWKRPPGFHRHAWNAGGLVGESPFWGRFWELDALSSAQRALLERVRAAILNELTRFGESADRFGLIHADLVPDNVLVDGERLRLIDFDDAGFGWHLFEIATSLYFVRREPFYETARDALVAAYRDVRPLPEAHLRLLPMFLAARGTTYLGWLHARRGEAAAQALTPQLIGLALAAAEDYLAARA